MRTFVAIDIPSIPPIQDLYHDLFLNLKGIEMKYSDLSNLHITLAFLGETTNEHIKIIGSGLDTVTIKTNRMELELHGLGIFKSIYKPQVLWIGIKTNDIFRQLWASVSLIIEKHGFKPDERGFSPHLTIGRIKNTHPDHNLLKFIQQYENKSLGRLNINEFIFYQSILTSQGAIYKPIRKFNIK